MEDGVCDLIVYGWMLVWKTSDVFGFVAPTFGWCRLFVHRSTYILISMVDVVISFLGIYHSVKLVV